MTKRAKQSTIACLVPILILLGMCFTPLYTLLTGEEITLKTIPIDPSNVFRGDSVTLHYEVEEVSKQLVEQAVLKKFDGKLNSLTVYVLLKETNGVYSPIKVTLDKPSKGIFLKGKLNDVGTNGNGKETAFISYGLDNYYIPDNTGADWEQASIHGQLLAKVKVKNGYAILTKITK